MATWATVQAEIEAALAAITFDDGATAVKATRPGGLLAQGESSFDAHFDLAEFTPGITKTMQGPVVRDGTLAFQVRVGHRFKADTDNASFDSQQLHVDRTNKVLATLLNKDVNVPSAVGLFSDEQGRLVTADDPFPTTTYSIIPLRARWRT